MIRRIKYWLSPKWGYSKDDIVKAYGIGYIKACGDSRLNELTKYPEVYKLHIEAVEYLNGLDNLAESKAE